MPFAEYTTLDTNISAIKIQIIIPLLKFSVNKYHLGISIIGDFEQPIKVLICIYQIIRSQNQSQEVLNVWQEKVKI